MRHRLRSQRWNQPKASELPRQGLLHCDALKKRSQVSGLMYVYLHSYLVWTIAIAKLDDAQLLAGALSSCVSCFDLVFGTCMVETCSLRFIPVMDPMLWWCRVIDR